MKRDLTMFIFLGHELPIQASSQRDVNTVTSRDESESTSQISSVNVANSVNESEINSQSDTNSQVPNMQSENSVRLLYSLD